MNKRGRPKMNRPTIDYGTEEFQQKKRRGETQDYLETIRQLLPLDDAQYQAALTLRRLFVTQFGVPHAQSKNLAEALFHSGNSTKPEHLNTHYYKQYQRLVETLRDALSPGELRTLYGICVYNHVSSLFLKKIADYPTSTHRELLTLFTVLTQSLEKIMDRS